MQEELNRSFTRTNSLGKHFNQATEFQLADCYCQPRRTGPTRLHDTRGTDKKCITVQRTCRSRATINMTGNSKWVTTTSDKAGRLRTPIRDLDASTLTRHRSILLSWLSRDSSMMMMMMIISGFSKMVLHPFCCRESEKYRANQIDMQFEIQKSNTLMSKGIYYRADL